MAKQLMIYEKVVPVSSLEHKDLCVESGVPYHFAREVRAVPLVAEEIPHAAREYAVVFAATDKDCGVTPFAILGAKEDENVYVTEEGEWNANYIPAFVRRYPFVFAANDDASKYTLCIDESWQGCNKDGRGERLFDEKGERTPFVDRLLKFNEDYQRSAQRTSSFCKKLRELDLLDAKEAKLKLSNGEDFKLTGFLVVNREKLMGLKSKQLGEVMKSGALELAFAHLLSMNNLATMANKVAARQTVDAETN